MPDVTAEIVALLRKKRESKLPPREPNPFCRKRGEKVDDSVDLYREGKWVGDEYIVVVGSLVDGQIKERRVG